MRIHHIPRRWNVRAFAVIYGRLAEAMKFLESAGFSRHDSNCVERDSDWEANYGAQCGRFDESGCRSRRGGI